MKKKINNEEPDINNNEYQISLAKALNYFNENWDKENYKNATIEYASSIGIELPKNIPEWDFRNIGGVCHLLLRNQFIDLNHYNYVIKRLNELKVFKKEVKEEKIPETKKEVDIKFLVDLEDFIDSYILGKNIDFKKLSSLYNSYGYGQGEARKIDSYISKQVKVYNNHINTWDEDIKESYFPKTKADIKKLVDGLEEFKSTLVKITTSTKTKPKKAKPASVQVKGMAYSKNMGELVGKHPKDVIGKNVVVIYDTENRDLIILHALAGKFTASGMSFTNLDTTKCIKKKLRKPDEVIPELINKKTKKELMEYFDTIKTTEQKSPGRMSESKIILGTY